MSMRINFLNKSVFLSVTILAHYPCHLFKLCVYVCRDIFLESIEGFF